MGAYYLQSLGHHDKDQSHDCLLETWEDHGRAD